MLKIGIGRPSSSCWLSALCMVPENAGDWRTRSDYGALNIMTVPDHYPLPNIQDFITSLHGNNYLLQGEPYEGEPSDSHGERS